MQSKQASKKENQHFFKNAFQTQKTHGQQKSSFRSNTHSTVYQFQQHFGFSEHKWSVCKASSPFGPSLSEY